LESNWRWNAELVGLGGPQLIRVGTTGVELLFRVDLVGELITPFVFNGVLQTHMVRLYHEAGFDYFTYGHLLMGTWFDYGGGITIAFGTNWPYFPVLPD